jgi:hypothetical protein
MFMGTIPYRCIGCSMNRGFIIITIGMLCIVFKHLFHVNKCADMLVGIPEITARIGVSSGLEIREYSRRDPSR